MSKKTKSAPRVGDMVYWLGMGLCRVLAIYPERKRDNLRLMDAKGICYWARLSDLGESPKRSLTEHERNAIVAERMRERIFGMWGPVIRN